MLHPFVSTQAAQLGGQGLALSTIVHATLIAGAVAATGAPLAPPHGEPPPTVEHIAFVPATVLVPAASTSAAPVRARAAGRALRWMVSDATAAKLAALAPAVLDPLTPSLDLAPTVDFAGLAAASADFGDAGGAVIRRALGQAYLRASGGVYSEEAVEKAVASRRGNPLPAYPRTMLASRTEASFSVRFVVDSSGRVDAGTIVVPATVHRDFAASVREALRRSRYLPAELGGRRVRQLVEQRFVFEVRDVRDAVQ